MSLEIPLGQAESQKLEFKSRDSLKHLPNVSREVVAMLNSGGGEIWIGLAEEHGRAVQVEPIEHPNREINRLRDHFSDAIEPSPITGEIKVEPVHCDGDSAILKVSVRPSKARKPYAVRDGTARHFLKRVEDRLRMMSTDEYRGEIIKQQMTVDLVRSRALEKNLKARERHRTTNRLWLMVQPLGGSELALTKDFQEYFSNPSKTGNRYTGWNFSDPYKRMVPVDDGIVFGRDDETCVRVFRDGAIEFTMPIINLYWKSADGVSRADAKEIWPYCLLEYPTSIFRLASTIYKERHFESDTFLSDLALFGLMGWTLRPFSPVSFGYKLANKPQPFEKDELVLDEPVTFTHEQIIHEPDRCAFRLITQIYRKFKIWEEDMPPEFNQDTGKLVLPGV